VAAVRRRRPRAGRVQPARGEQEDRARDGRVRRAARRRVLRPVPARPARPGAVRAGDGAPPAPAPRRTGAEPDVTALRCALGRGRTTEVEIGVDLGADLAPCLARLGPGRRTFAVVDAAVDGAHGARLAALATRFVLPGGEQSKTLATLERILRALAMLPADRDTIVVVAGGGSIGDVGGLAASLYARGLDLVLLPTTLLAMVDSCVGGKTAIDLPEGKNLAGTFHPARLVAIDFAFLTSLPQDEFRSGLGELLKVAVGLSPALFDLIEAHADALLARDPDTLARAVQLALAAKITVVEADPEDRGARRLLNLGHTLGHALEAHAGYRVAHGIAVARGVHFAIALAARLGVLAA